MALRILPFFKLIWGHLFARLAATSVPLHGRTYLITGSNTGIGYALGVHLARLHPARLILAVRDAKKGLAAKDKIIAETGYTGTLDVWELDMADFASVRAFARRAQGELPRLDGAVLNSGTYPGKWTVTADGWEQCLQINAIATGFLAVILLPLLQSTSRLTPLEGVPTMAPHLTITGSSSHFFADFPERNAENTLEALNKKSKKALADRYNVTKLINLFIARKMGELRDAEGVIINVVDPGTCNTQITRDLSLPNFILYLFDYVGWTPSKGALNLLYALLSPTPTGSYISACAITRPSKWSMSPEGLKVQDKVWQEMALIWKKIAPETVTILKNSPAS